MCLIGRTILNDVSVHFEIAVKLSVSVHFEIIIEFTGSGHFEITSDLTVPCNRNVTIHSETVYDRFCSEIDGDVIA